MCEMEEDVYRIVFDDECEQEDAEKALDDAGVWYDYDSGDRMMIQEDGLAVLDEAGVDFDEV